jgi:drug/metabolite transporter (DMT)-like permease
MPEDKPLRVALLIVGLIFLVGLLPLTMIWPAGFMWEPRQTEYEQMIIGVYAVLGIFLIIASRNPAEHRSLIWFTVWSSLIHGLIMLAQALRDPVERPNLMGDVPALILIAVVLAFLMRSAKPGGSAA